MFTHFRLCLLFCVAVLAGCGGGGSSLPQSAARPNPAPAATGQPAVSGTITSVTSSTINLNGGPNCGFVNVSYDSGTTISANGYSLAPGVFASVYGSGSCSTSFTASAISLASSGTSGAGSPSNGSSVPTPAPVAATTSQTHVLTADYLGGFAGTTSVSFSTAASVLSWAEINIQDANAISGAGIKTLEYVDPFRQASNDPLYNSDDSTFSHDCGGNRISIPYKSGVTQWLMNPGSSSLQSVMNGWQAAEEAAGHIDAFYYDDIDTIYGLPVLPCNFSQSSWDSENSSFIGASQNGVVFSGYGLSSDAAPLINLSTVRGGAVEECYGRTGQPNPPYTSDSDWVAHENLQLAAGAAGKLFFCYNTPTPDAASSIGLRQYIYASFLIGFSPSSSVLWEYFTTPSGLHVFPETKLVPSSPLSSPSSVSGLQSGGVYVREYAACYLGGAGIGHCAAVVNPSSSSSANMPSLSQSYSHTMTISGYGIVDGGSVSASGPAAPPSLPPNTGVVLVQ